MTHHEVRTRYINGLRALGRELGLQKELITNRPKTKRELDNRVSLGLSSHPLTEWWSSVQLGGILTDLEALRVLTENKRQDKFVPPLLPPLLIAAVFQNRPFFGDVTSSIYGTVWDGDGTPVTLARSKQEATKLMANAYRRTAEVVGSTPELQQFKPDDQLDTQVIGLLLGRSTIPARANIQAVIDRKSSHTPAAAIPAFLLSATGGLLLGTGIQTAEPPLQALMDTGATTILTTGAGMFVANRIARSLTDDSSASRAGCAAEVVGGTIGMATGVGGTVTLHTIDQQVIGNGDIPFIGTTAVGTVLLTELFKAGLDHIYGSADEVQKRMYYWLGTDPSGTEQVKGGRIGELGRKSPHMLPLILALRDRLYIELTHQPWDQRGKLHQHMGLPTSSQKRAPKELEQFVLTLPNIDFAHYDDDSRPLIGTPDIIRCQRHGFVGKIIESKLARQMCYLLTHSHHVPADHRKPVEWAISAPSQVMTATAAAEWIRTIARARVTPVDMLRSDRLPHPDIIQEFFNARIKARQRVIGSLDNPDWALKILFALPSAFRFAHPELADPTKWPAWYDSTRFGQLGENPGNTGVLYGVLRTYWTDLLQLARDASPLHYFLRSVIYPSPAQANDALYNLQHTFNEIVGSQLLVEAFTGGLLFATGTGQIKEQLKALTTPDVINTIIESPQHMMLYMSVLSTLEFYKRTLVQTCNDLYYPHYKSTKDAASIKWLDERVDEAYRNMDQLQGEIVTALTHAFLNRDPNLLVSDQPQQQNRLAAISANFVYFMYQLGIEQPRWSSAVAQTIKTQLSASGATWDGSPRNMQGLYAMAFVLKLYKAAVNQDGKTNIYGINVEENAEATSIIQGHVTELGTDTINTHLGFGPRTASIPQTSQTLEEAKSAVQVAGEVLPNDMLGQLIQAATYQLQIAISAQNAVTSRSELRERTATLGITLASLIQRLEQNTGLKNQDIIAKANATLLLADEALHLDINHDAFGIHMTPAFFSKLTDALRVLSGVIPPDQILNTVQAIIQTLTTQNGETRK